MTVVQTNHASLQGYPVAIEIPVLWGELDAYGHVNNTVYFKYFESARMAYLDACRVLDSYERDHTGIILYSTECRFRSALHHPDAVLVGARTTDIAKDRFTMAYAVLSSAQNRIAAEGRAILVWFDYEKRCKIALPASVRDAIMQLDPECGTHD